MLELEDQGKLMVSICKEGKANAEAGRMCAFCVYTHKFTSLSTEKTCGVEDTQPAWWVSAYC